MAGRGASGLTSLGSSLDPTAPRGGSWGNVPPFLEPPLLYLSRRGDRSYHRGVKSQ